MDDEKRRKSIEDSLQHYGINLSTTELSVILGCSRKTAFKLQQENLIKSFVLNSESKKKVLKTAKADLIEYMLTNK